MRARTAAAVLLLAACGAEAPNPVAPPSALPPPATLVPVPVVVAAAGDIVCAPNSRSACRQMGTAALLTRLDPQLVIPLGDTQYENGELPNFNLMYEPSWGRMRGITRPVIGNHEYQTPAARGYFDYFNGVGQFTGPAGDRDKGYYSFDLPGWHVVVLNSECRAVGGCHAGSPQERWLRADLAALGPTCILAASHHPLVSSGPNGPTPALRPLFQALYDAGADLFLSAHDHLYERLGPVDPAGNPDPRRGIRQIVSGLGGHSTYSFRQPAHPASEVRYNAEYGVLRLVLHRSSYEWQFINVSDAVVDAGLGDCR